MALLQLATRFEGRLWEEIARHMPHPRTAFRCFSRYQRSLNNSIIRIGWTQENLDLMRRSIWEFGYFTDSPEDKSWQAVVGRMGPGRLQQQVHNLFQRWGAVQRSHVEPWTKEQIFRLDTAMRIYGYDCVDWKTVLFHIPGRDIAEIGARWRQYQTPFRNLDAWTREEDARLLAAVQKHGTGDWCLLSADFPSRTHRQMATRFRQLRPEQARLYELLMATQRRLLPTGFSKGFLQQ
ncbi:unnamed protein product [Effrenium voratum]|nr:unnamed protein product [Effrenium voratum]